MQAIPASLPRPPGRSSRQLRFAIDRFLAAKITPMHLQSWCYAHFDQSHDSESDRQFWQVTMLNLAVFHACDFHRSALELSLVVLLTSIDTHGTPCATPLTTSECCYELQRRRRRTDVVDEPAVTRTLGAA